MTSGKAKPNNLLTAFVVAPLSGAGFVAAMVAMFGVFVGGWGSAGGGVAVMLFVLVSLVGYVLEIIGGIPGYILFRRLGWIHRAHWIALGAVLGAIAAAIWPIRVLLLNPNVNYGIEAVGVLAAAGLAWGAAAGIGFAWVIKIEPSRADKIAPIR